jgi:hypothetical protein
VPGDRYAILRDERDERRRLSAEPIELPAALTVKEFADRTGMGLAVIIRELLQNGIPVSWAIKPYGTKSFNDVDFTEATLTRADLRASHYTRVNLTRADLSNTDMRRAEFEDCIFTEAVMDGCILTHAQGTRLPFSSLQKSAIAWTDDDGPESGGG